MKTRILILISLLLSFTILASNIIKRTEPYEFLNDYAGLLSNNESVRINTTLKRISKENKSEIVLLIVKKLNNYSSKNYALKIMKKWNIGKNYNNKGVIILIKPKYLHEKGEIFIGVTSKLSDRLPNRTINSIIKNTIIPNFKNGQYFIGISKGISILNSLLAGKINSITYDRKLENHDYANINTILIIGILIIIILLIILYLGLTGYFGSLKNILIIGIISILLGIIGLILRFEIVSTLLGTKQLVISLLLNNNTIKATYWFTVIISIVLIVIGAIFTLKPLLIKMKDESS